LDLLKEKLTYTLVSKYIIHILIATAVEKNKIDNIADQILEVTSGRIDTKFFFFLQN
jgi:hypothetical protein